MYHIKYLIIQYIIHIVNITIILYIENMLQIKKIYIKYKQNSKSQKYIILNKIFNLK